MTDGRHSWMKENGRCTEEQGSDKWLDRLNEYRMGGWDDRVLEGGFCLTERGYSALRDAHGDGCWQVGGRWICG